MCYSGHALIEDDPRSIPQWQLDLIKKGDCCWLPPSRNAKAGPSYQELLDWQKMVQKNGGKIERLLK